MYHFSILYEGYVLKRAQEQLGVIYELTRIYVGGVKALHIFLEWHSPTTSYPPFYMVAHLSLNHTCVILYGDFMDSFLRLADGEKNMFS